LESSEAFERIVIPAAAAAAAQELHEAEDDSGNIILIERLDGSGAVQAHINGHDMNAHLQEIRVNPSGSIDVHLQVKSLYFNAPHL